MKVCSKCGVEQLEADFYKDPRKEDGLRSVCKTCWSTRKKAYKSAHREELAEKDHLYYEANKARINQRTRQWRRDNHEELMERQRVRRQTASDFLSKLKTPCVKCGEERTWVIQFHHINPSSKVFELSVDTISHKKLETVNQELGKCVCLCANCHTEFHHFYGKNPADPVADFQKYLGG